MDYDYYNLIIKIEQQQQQLNRIELLLKKLLIIQANMDSNEDNKNNIVEIMPFKNF